MESKDRIEMPIYVTDENGNKRQVDSLVFVRERTCKMEHIKGGAMYDVWRCSACGYEYAESVSEKGIVQNYCPSCGCKVPRNTPKCSETTTGVVGK